MSARESIFETLEEDVHNIREIDDATRKKLYSNIMRLRDIKLNIMVTGATGCGKSSTINALFDTDIAKVGIGVDPETMDITKYDLNNLILWDSPGLGDGKEKDNQHAKNITQKLNELDENNQPLIDLVLVILDGSSRDLGTSYELINNVIIPNLGKNASNRILVAINQADVAMKGRHWDHEHNKPEPKLEQFLNEKVESVKRRIQEATGVSVDPIFYSAGFKDEYEEQNPYNLSKLLYLIVKSTPKEKRVVLADDKIAEDPKLWKDDDGLGQYIRDTKASLWESVIEGASKGADIGGEIGRVFGKTGEVVGRVVGAVAGGLIEGIKSLF